MNLHTRAPLIVPDHRPLVNPFLHPPSLHPSCVLALLPQWDDKWVDYSGRGNHGIVHGATPTAKGRHGFAYSFDGVDDYVDCGNDASLNITDTITIEARVNNKLTVGTGFIGSKALKHSDWAYRLYVNPFSVTFDIWTPGRTFITAPVTTDVWTHIVGAYDGVQMKLHVNGLLESSAGKTGSIHVNTLPVLVGVSNDVNAATFFNYFNGLIPLIRIYNAAWSPNPADPNYLPEIDPGPPPYNW